MKTPLFYLLLIALISFSCKNKVKTETEKTTATTEQTAANNPFNFP